MDKKTMMEKAAREAFEKGAFNGTWLYAESGKIISKGAYGWRDFENRLPMREDSVFELALALDVTAQTVHQAIKKGYRCKGYKIKFDDPKTPLL